MLVIYFCSFLQLTLLTQLLRDSTRPFILRMRDSVRVADTEDVQTFIVIFTFYVANSSP